jgi:integrase/recombinase XerD
MLKQAKTITPQDMRRLLDFVAANKHHVRNRTMLLATQLASMRVGEVASLHYGDVYTAEGAVRDQIHLIPEQTKGRHARAVFVDDPLTKSAASSG